MLYPVRGEEGIFRIEEIFPTEAQMDRSDFVLLMPKQLAISENRLFVLDQGEHGIHVFNLDGTYLHTFGQRGRGPGELVLPHAISVSGDDVLVVDQQNLLHFFNSDGQFLNRKPMIDFIYRLVHTRSGFFIHTLNRKTDYTFGLFDPDGNKLKSLSDQFGSSYNHPIQDNSLTLKSKENMVYALQRYGSGFRVFGESGEPIKKGNVAFTPLNEEEYKSLGISYTYRTFDIYKNRFVGCYSGLGVLKFHVFDSKGEFLARPTIPIPRDLAGKDEIVGAMDIIIVEKDKAPVMYVLLVIPVGKVLKIELEEAFFSPPT